MCIVATSDVAGYTAHCICQRWPAGHCTMFWCRQYPDVLRPILSAGLIEQKIVSLQTVLLLLGLHSVMCACIHVCGCQCANDRTAKEHVIQSTVIQASS